MTTHTMIVPNEPRHTVHDVALERSPEESTGLPIRKLARSQAEKALKVLAAIMNDTEVTASTRVLAAIEVIDRAWGKAIPAAADDAADAKRLETIRRIIVDPGHSDEPGFHPADATGPL